MDELKIKPDDPQALQNGRLDSWKEIAVYLGRDVRTVQRWEKKEGLPVHRHLHEKLGTVYAYKSELDAWWNTDEHKPLREQPPEPASSSSESFDETTEEEWLRESSISTDIAAWFNLQRTWLTLATVSLLVLISAFVVIRYLRARPDNKRVRLIVLPLENYGGDVSQVPFTQGMTEELIAELGRLNPKELGVIARTTAATYAGKPIEKIRSDLKIDYLIEGSVFRDKDKVRITIQLIAAKDETHTWSKSYEEDLHDVIALQEKVATEIAGEIKVRLGALPEPRRVNPEAYDAFLRGRFFWNKRSLEGVRKSVEYFTQAVQLDPNYAPAYAGLGDAFAVIGSTQSGAMPPSVAFPKAKQFAIRSAALDPTLAEPHASLGYIYLVFERDPKTAAREFNRALELNPRYVTALQWYGLYYESQGKPKAAIASVKLALDQEPMSLPANIALSEAYYFDRDYDHAIEQGLKTIELAPASALAHFNLGRAYEQENQHEKALAEFQQSRNFAANPATIVPFGYTYGRMGQREKANATLLQLQELAQKQYVPAVYWAMIYTGLGQKDKAFEWLDRSFDEQCDYLVFLDQDPMTDPLRSDPRFASLLKRVAPSH
jgi:TolB-like protein/Flp pilus assembly protein TadD